MATRQRRRKFSGPDGQPLVLVAPHLSQPFVEGVARYAHIAGWMLDIFHWRRREMRPVGPEDGILCDGADFDDLVSRAKQSGAALVRLGSGTEQGVVAYAQPNYAAVGRLAGEHFKQRGYRHVACATFTPDSAISGPMIRGLRTGFGGRVSILKCEPEDPPIPLEVLAALPRPLGLFAVSDGLATAALEWCRMLGLAVPEQVGVLGAGNDSILCRLAEMPLSSVEADLETVGYEGAALLDKLMNGHRIPARPVEVPPKGVVARRSTEYAGCGHPDVEAAVRFIAAHYREPITSERVAEETGLSRRRLDGAMTKEIQRTISGEIEHRRVDAAANMLLETALSGEQIARACGFAEHRALIRAFRRQRGCTPAAYRNEQRR